MEVSYQMKYYVEFIYWRDDGWDCYDSMYYELKDKTIDEILRLKQTWHIKFRIFEKMEANINGIKLFSGAINYSPYVVFDPRNRKDGELDLEEAESFFISKMHKKRELAQN